MAHCHKSLRHKTTALFKSYYSIEFKSKRIIIETFKLNINN